MRKLQKKWHRSKNHIIRSLNYLFLKIELYNKEIAFLYND